MKLVHATLAALAATLPMAAPAPAQHIGEPAPLFTLTDSRGIQHSLQRYLGSWVVLEWVNYGCPYVQKHYRTGNIPDQQERWTEEGVIWLAVASSAPGEQGYFDDAERLTAASERWGSRATAVLLDSEGVAGRLYHARTTPHLFVIDPAGEIVYMGGIDDVPTSRDDDLALATQLVDLALTEATSGQRVTVPVSRPYGCSVKYGEPGS